MKTRLCVSESDRRRVHVWSDAFGVGRVVARCESRDDAAALVAACNIAADLAEQSAEWKAAPHYDGGTVRVDATLQRCAEAWQVEP